MTGLRVLAFRLRALFLGRRRDGELTEEIQAHLDLLADDYERRGLSPADARLAARRDFGGVEQIKEAFRDQRRLPFVDALAQDLRYGARMLRRSPGFAATAILSLALGIGANTAVFTLIDALLLRTLPVREPHALVEMEAQRQGDFALLSFPMYRDLRERQQVLTDILASAGETPYRLTIPGAAGATAELDNQRVSFVSGNYFNVLGVQPALGRFFTPDDDRNPHTAETLGSVVVLSDGFWERQFGRDPGVLGRTILIGRSPARIVGVAPRGFFGEAVGASPVAWVPLVPFSDASSLEKVSAYIARLKPGVSREQAEAAMTVLFQQLLAAEGRIRTKIDEQVIALTPAATGIDFGLRRRFATPLLIAMALVWLVLLIACANVANLLLARAASRRGEIGIRLAMGCSRPRLIGQLITESVLLSILGAAAGVAVAWWGTRSLHRMVSFGPVLVPLDLSPDIRTLGFLVAVGVLTGVGFGLVPAIRATRLDLAPALKGTLRGQARGPLKQRFSRALVTAQIALSLLLLIGAGLLIRSLQNLHGLDWGFKPAHVLIFSVAHNAANREPAAMAAAAKRIHEHVRQVPGVQSASLSSVLMFSPSNATAPLTIRDYSPAADERVMARFNCVSPGYFETVGMTLVAGRGIEDRDTTQGPRVAVVNEAMARRYWPQGRAVGRMFESWGPALAGPSGKAAPTRPIEIVGIVRNAKVDNLREDVQPMFYVPIVQMPRSVRAIEVRTIEPAAAIAGRVRQAISEATREVMIRSVVTLADQVDQSLAGELMIMRLSSVFGALALLLACVGLYGVMAYAVAQRTGEIGIRMALGASEVTVVWLVVRDTLRLVSAGTVLGLCLAAGTTRMITAFLYGLTPTDPSTIGIATMALVGAAAAASYLPARRAARIDPMTALRQE